MVCPKRGSPLAPESVAIEVSKIECCLEEEHGSGPDGWNTSEPGKQELRDERLYEEKEKRPEDPQGAEDPVRELWTWKGRGVERQVHGNPVKGDLKPPSVGRVRGPRGLSTGVELECTIPPKKSSARLEG